MSHFLSHKMNLPMYGEKKEEILETMRYYFLERRHEQEKDMPSEESINESIIEVPKLKIECFWPVFHVNHFLEAKVMDDTIVSVNTNALEHVLGQLKRSDELKRGQLYKFSPGQYFNPGMFPYVFLPEKVMKAMKEYNWAQHNEQLREWGIVEQNFWEKLQNSNMLTLAGLRGHGRKRKQFPKISNN